MHNLAKDGMPLFRKGERQDSDCVNFGKRLKEKEKCDETKGRNGRSLQRMEIEVNVFRATSLRVHERRRM